jgi:nitrite reductase (NADH) small subunit
LKHIVCNQEEIVSGEMRAYLINNKTSIVVGCNKNNEYFAVRDVCPHQGARLSQGELTWNTISNEPSTYEITREGEIIRCPWHSFDFDTKSGQCMAAPQRMKVKTYKVIVEDGRVVVEV